VDSTKFSAPEQHSRPQHKRIRRLLDVLMSSCASCGTRDADYFVSVPDDHLTFASGEELCEGCSIDHGLV
jgi:hypothetical protein